MKDLLQETDTVAVTAVSIGRLLTEHKGTDVIIMDMRPLNFWTDFFIITTITSRVHLNGLERHIKEFTAENDLPMRSYRSADKESDEWHLVDLGDIVIHLMTEKTRDFYELENLWSSARVLK